MRGKRKIVIPGIGMRISYIKIYNKNATKEKMIEYLKEFTSIEDVVTFGTIKDQYDVYIETNDVNKVVREVRKRYEPIFK